MVPLDHCKLTLNFFFFFLCGNGRFIFPLVLFQLLPILYGAGLVLLRRQYRQEREARERIAEKMNYGEELGRSGSDARLVGG